MVGHRSATVALGAAFLAVHDVQGAQLASMRPKGDRKKAFLLDIDGTLARTDDIYQLAFKELLTPYGYDVDEAWYKANVHGGVDKEVFERLMPSDYTPKQIVQVGKKKDKLFCKKAKENGLQHIEGLGDALAMCKAEGVRCIAVTNAPRPAAELVLKDIRKKHKAGNVIEGLIVGAECPAAKPAPDPYLIAMKKLNIEPKDCIVFEDSRSGCKSGVAAKVAAVVGVRSELQDSDLKAAGATRTVADWTEVTPKLVDELLALRGGAAEVHFPMITEPIKYEGPDSTNLLAFKYYNADEVIMGKTMKEWLRFAVCYWHTWRGFGADIFGLTGTAHRPWDGADMAAHLKRVDVHFEFCQKLGIEYYCFHDRDVSPEGATVAETEANFDIIAEKLAAKQAETGIKLLWGTCNLFSHERYMNGGMTNPDPDVVCMAAAQVKKCLEVTTKLGGENFVFWGGREGYFSLLNTNYKLEQDNRAAFLKCAADYADKIGFKGALLLEPKPREPTSHQYDYDAETTLGFLDHHGLIDRFALNLEANHATLAGHTGEHETQAAFARGKLGSIDANRNEAMLGWDTDMFPTDPALSTYVMKCVIEQGGLAPGGLNFDAKVRRESTDIIDLFVGHISGMDNYARGLRAAAKMIEEGRLAAQVTDRYAGFDKDLGKKFSEGKATLEMLAAHAAKSGEPKQTSGKMEAAEAIFNMYAYKG